MTGLRPVLAEPDQRYWRRRANRRVRKARRVRVLLRGSLLLALNGAVAVILTYSTVHVARTVARSDEFALDRIEIEGIQRASAAAIRRQLGTFAGKSLLQIDLAEVERTVRKDPWIRSAAVRRVLPTTLRIDVRERRPAAIAILGGLAHLVDGTGYVIGPAEGGPGDDLPLLTGLNGLDDEELVRELRRGTLLLARLNRVARPFFDRISELDLSGKAHVTVRTVFNGPQILLDPGKVERNVLQYMGLEREIERRAGELDYVDLRWRNRIAVMPAKTTGRGG